MELATTADYSSAVGPVRSGAGTHENMERANKKNRVFVLPNGPTITVSAGRLMAGEWPLVPLGATWVKPTRVGQG